MLITFKFVQNFNSIGSGVSEAHAVENCYLPLTEGITLSLRTNVLHCDVFVSIRNVRELFSMLRQPRIILPKCWSSLLLENSCFIHNRPTLDFGCHCETAHERCWHLPRQVARCVCVSVAAIVVDELIGVRPTSQNVVTSLRLPSGLF